MPTSETGISISNPGPARRFASRFGVRRRSHGFSLLEIMVVVAIIGLVTAATLIRFAGNTRDTQLDEEAERLEALFSYVREQAELQTRDYGLKIDDKKYSFVVFDVIGDQWRSADEDDALREREFPVGMEPHVVVEGRAIVLDSRKKGIEDFSPQVMIFANGDLSSFEVTLQREGDDEKKARLYSDDQNAIVLLLPGEVEQKNPPVRAAAVTR
jgi:general secretion pathway protein H